MSQGRAAATVDARRLREVVTLADERRRAARGVLGRLEHPLARGLGGGLLGAGLIYAIATGSSPAEARGWWVLGCLLSSVVLVLGGPFRIFWRRDSTLLARLPIDGDALYRLGARLTLRAAGGYLLGLLCGVAPLVPFLELRAVLHLVFLAAVLVVTAGLASLSAATLAGAIVASARAQAVIQELASGQSAPGTVWLSMLPAGFAFGVVLVGYTAASAPDAATLRLWLVGAVTVAGALFEVTRRVARGVLSEATREVAALDAVRLAHVDRSQARGLERLAGRLAGGARMLYEKDVAVMRRRHPGYYLLTGLGILALWVVAFVVDDPERTRVVLGGAGALVGYALILARRLTVPPSEHPRLLATLPLTGGAVAWAKTVHVGWRIVWAVVVGGAPAVWRSERPVVVVVGLAAVAVVGVVVGGWLVRRE